MHERKLKMFENADAFVAMPGGLGTLDEMFEVMTWKQIGLHKKNIVFWNLDGYWSPLIENLLPNLIQEGFVREEDLNLYAVADTLDDVIQALHAPPEGAVDFVAKWGPTYNNTEPKNADIKDPKKRLFIIPNHALIFPVKKLTTEKEKMTAAWCKVNSPRSIPRSVTYKKGRLATKL
ncbi:putative cytokinin riboside 5'-monophosphate phosphoribohydrolase LOGL2, partial [Stylophora pistillata]